MRHLAAIWLAFEVLSSTLAVAQPVFEGHDDPVARARHVEELSQEGISDYMAGRYREALTKFKAALALHPVANLLFNIAKAHEQLGELENALVYYERFIKSGDADDTAREKARQRVREIKAILDARRQNDATTNPSITVQDTTVGESQQSAVEIAGWISTGTGAGLLVLGGTFAVLALGAESDFSSTERLDEKREYRSDAERYALIADIALGVGAAAAVAGVTMLIVDATGGSSSSVADVGGEFRLMPHVDANSVGLGAVVSF